MKSLTTILLTLLMSMGAWAEVIGKYPLKCNFEDSTLPFYLYLFPNDEFPNGFGAEHINPDGKIDLPVCTTYETSYSCGWPWDNESMFSIHREHLTGIFNYVTKETKRFSETYPSKETRRPFSCSLYPLEKFNEETIALRKSYGKKNKI